MGGLGSQWFSHKMNDWDPLQLKKIKILGARYGALPIWPIWPNFEVNGLDWLCWLVGTSKTAPRIFVFSIVLGAEYLSYVKFIETHARAFFTLDILFIETVK